MSLWYFSKPDKMDRATFHKESISSDVYLCNPGPSLRYIDPQSLKQPGVLTAAVNTAYPRIRPDIWFGMDDPHCYPRQVFWESFIKVMRGGFQDRKCEGLSLQNCFNLYYIDGEVFDGQNNFFDFKGHDVNFTWTGNALFISIHVLLWMGAKRIHLLGCDLSTKDGHYHSDQVLSESNLDYNNQLYEELNAFLKWYSGEAAEHGIEIISCSPDSRINEYLTYLPLNVAIKQTQDRYNIPFGGDLLHSRDVKI